MRESPLRQVFFFAQGETFEEARANLQDVIEGNLLLALQLGLEIPKLACRVRSSCVPKLIREIIDEVVSQEMTGWRYGTNFFLSSIKTMTTLPL